MLLNLLGISQTALAFDFDISNGTAVTGWGPSSFQAVLDAVLNAVVKIGTLVIAVMIVWSGFLFVTSSGDPAKLTTARQAFLWTIIGAAIILGAEAIKLSIQNTIPTI